MRADAPARNQVKVLGEVSLVFSALPRRCERRASCNLQRRAAGCWTCDGQGGSLCAQVVLSLLQCHSALRAAPQALADGGAAAAPLFRDLRRAAAAAGDSRGGRLRRPAAARAALAAGRRARSPPALQPAHGIHSLGLSKKSPQLRRQGRRHRRFSGAGRREPGGAQCWVVPSGRQRASHPKQCEADHHSRLLAAGAPCHLEVRRNVRVPLTAARGCA